MCTVSHVQRRQRQLEFCNQEVIENSVSYAHERPGLHLPPETRSWSGFAAQDRRPKKVKLLFLNVACVKYKLQQREAKNRRLESLGSGQSFLIFLTLWVI